MQEVVDLAGVNGLVASQSGFPQPTFHIDDIEDYRMDDRHVGDQDRWSFELIDRCFRYKDLELEDDPEFRLRHPSNRFKIHSFIGPL